MTTNEHCSFDDLIVRGKHCHGNVKKWLAEQNLIGTYGKRYVDVGALWRDGTLGFGETISVAAKYTRQLTIIDPVIDWWPPVRDKLLGMGISCEYHPMDVLKYAGPPFDVCQCTGVIYHFPDPDLLWAKLTEIVRERLVIHTIAVPHWILDRGRMRLTDCTPEMRHAVEEFWNARLGTEWVKPESEMGQQCKYAAMHQVYSYRRLLREATDYGWQVVFDLAWGNGLNVALLLER
jgi:hypothetical protein